MKKFFLIALICFKSCIYAYPPPQEEENLESITYEMLSTNDWTDHVRSFHELFKLTKVSSFLEFGCGRSTKFFLDNCDKVTSVELVITEYRDKLEPWYASMQHTFQHYKNWNSSMHFFSPVISIANGIALTAEDPEQTKLDYMQEIHALMDRVFLNNAFDVAFVDPGICLRGDLVNALFGKCDIIAVHDTNFNGKIYGWYKFKNDPNYEKIVSTYGSGTTFWVKKTKVDLIESLKKNLPQK